MSDDMKLPWFRGHLTFVVEESTMIKTRVPTHQSPVIGWWNYYNARGHALE